MLYCIHIFGVFIILIIGKTFTYLPAFKCSALCLVALVT